MKYEGPEFYKINNMSVSTKKAGGPVVITSWDNNDPPNPERILMLEPCEAHAVKLMLNLLESQA
jgi:hypothetical protein